MKNRATVPQLENSLRETARNNRSMPPEILETRIISAVRAEHRSTPEATQRNWARLLLPATVLVIAGAFFYPSSPIPRQSQPRLAQQTAFPSFPPIQLPTEDPLSGELNSLLADSRNAARSLAANFLPSQPRQ